MHDRRIGDKELTLGVSGKLVDGNLIMYDRETNTLWQQSSGAGMEGELAGQNLAELPEDEWAVLPWGEWLALHPDTLVLTCAHCEGRGEATGTITELDDEGQ